MRKSILFFYILFFTLELNAQNGIIYQLQNQPAQPSCTDSIFIIANAYFPSASCNRIRYETIKNGTDIYINSYHDYGMMTVICSRTDTAILAPLPSGTYQIYYTALDTQQIIIFDRDTMTLQVNCITPSYEVESAEPFQFKLIASTVEIITKEAARVEIFSMLGQKLKEISTQAGQIAYIDIKDQPNGRFLLVYTDKQKFKTYLIHNFKS